MDNTIIVVVKDQDELREQTALFKNLLDREILNHKAMKDCSEFQTRSHMVRICINGVARGYRGNYVFMPSESSHYFANRIN